jgi:hypothetical protein
MRVHGKEFKMTGRHIVLHILGGMVMAVVFGVLFGYFVMLLWNNLLPDLFGMKQITYWQGLGLVILARLLFGSHGFCNRGRHSGRFRRHKEGHLSCCGIGSDNAQKEIWWENEGRFAFQEYLKSSKIE